MDGAYAPACAQPLQCIEVGTLVKGRDRLEVQVLELGQHPEARVGQRIHGHRIAGPQQRTHGNVQSLLRAVDQEDAFRLDRKSTRLNSSHLVISYAVFCLKKKNTTRCTYACD